jgi:hypothetical protein
VTHAPLSGTVNSGGSATIILKMSEAVTVSGGTAIVSGTLVNSGALVASSTGGIVEIAGGAAVSGSAVQIANGIVDVRSGGTANVAFLATGSGGLMIADVSGGTGAFTGAVFGFGGVNHANHKQYIDLVSVTSAPNTISLSYASATGSGTLRVSSSGAVVASIELIGTYTSKNFSAKADGQGHVEIVDPTVPNGGSVAPAQRHRPAGHRLRCADDARLFPERRRHRRHLDGERRPPRRGNRADRQLHGRNLRHRRRRRRRDAGHARAA